MILSLSLTSEEFASKRRAAQDRLVERLSGVVGEFLSSGAISPLKAALTAALREEFKAESDRGLTARSINAFLSRVEKALDKATPESDPTVTALALALAVINEASILAASAEDGSIVLEWVTMHDGNVREAHQDASGQQRPVGEKFDVGGVKMRAPGDMTAPIALWINCRCTLRPSALEGEFTMKPSVATESLTAAPDVNDDTLCIMAVPADGQPVHDLSMEEAHATIVYFGDVPRSDESDDGAIDAIQSWTAKIAADAQPFTAQVKEIGTLGSEEEPATVWMLDESDLNGIHEGILSNDQVSAAYEDADTTKYPEYIPHVTIGYDVPLNGDAIEELTSVTEITFDRLAVWHGSDRYEYPLGEPMTAAAAEPEVVSDDEIETPPNAEAPEELVDDRIPWHGVIAPEGVASGDRRMFGEGSLRFRDLPLPLTWQKVSDDGHRSNVTVAMIEKVERIGNLIEASGHFLSSVPEADEVIGLISEFGRFGVSIDADDIGEYEMDPDSEMESYLDARVSAACIVAIPAFQEAYVAVGPHPVLDADPANGDVPEGGPVAEPGEEVAASASPLLKMAGVPEVFQKAARDRAARALADEFADVAPGRTEDGPGWVTDPIPTDRLRDYWVRGPGAAKIGWGAPGDFNRCRVNVADHVDPKHLNGYCANRHYDALGFWPGQEAAGNNGKTFATTARERLAANQKMPEGVSLEPAPALSLVASAGWSAPSEFFVEPVDCEPGSGVTITPEGRVFGYIAEWGVCHIGYDGICKEAPPSPSDYSYFRTGIVHTPDGPVEVGALTAATGHANARLAAMPAAAHYDNTGSVWAYVAAGENDRGIWFSGMVKPGAPEELLNDVVASGRLSGDWRPIGRDLELVAALTVNVPGFPIQKPTAAASNGRQLSLVAAGVPAPRVEDAGTIVVSSLEPGTMSMIASLVVDEMESRNTRRARLDAIKERVSR